MDQTTTFSQEELRSAQSKQMIYPMTFLDEVFIRVSDYIPEVKDYYFVSNYGRVCSVYNGYPVLMSAHISNAGYAQVSIVLKNGNRKLMLLHRIVMRCFCPIPNHEEMAVNHIDGVKYHNWLSNLEWVTNSENMIHCYRNNLEINGIDHPWTTITEEQVHHICQLMEQGLPNRIISETVFGDRDHIGIICSIRGKHSWVNISRNYNIDTPNPGKRLFNDDQLREIYRLSISTNLGSTAILREIGIDTKSLTKSQHSSMIRVVKQLREKTGYGHIYENYN